MTDNPNPARRRWRHGAVFLCLTVACAQGDDLPPRVDNSMRGFFPHIVKQEVDACSQFAGIHYIFTYELNRVRSAPGNDPKHQYAALFAWNFVNRGRNSGSEFFDGWQIARDMGIPAQRDWRVAPSRTIGGWMTGYDRYYRAMKNRAVSWDLFPMTNELQLVKAKQWLFNRNESDRYTGGLLAVDYRVSDWTIDVLPRGGYESGKWFVKNWSPTKWGHLMTCVGYDDRVGFDFNGDGEISNDRDITDDGRVDLADREQGMFIIANSWGPSFANQGRIYAPYRLHAITDWERGRWMGALTVASNTQPRMTLRVRFTANDRSALALRAGTSDDPDARDSVLTWSPLIFSRTSAPRDRVAPGSPEDVHGVFLRAERRLGTCPPLGPDSPGPIEMGFDLTSLWSPDTANVFLELRAHENASLEGVLHEAAILRYSPEGKLLDESAFSVTNAPLGKIPLRAGVRLAAPSANHLSEKK